MSDIQNIKERVGVAAEGIIASGLGLRKTGKKYHCPNIYAHRNNDKDPSMSWDSQRLQYYCFTCGHKIDIYGYYREHLNYSHSQVVAELLGETDLYRTSMHKEREQLKSHFDELKPITPDCIKYLQGRGISQQTIKRFGLKTYKGMIAFPYYKYTTLVGVKLRQPIPNPSPKMSSMTGSKPWLFGAQLVDLAHPELVICEGEIDALTLAEAGIKNAVSVGAGAHSVKSLVQQAEEFLRHFPTIIVASDNDKAGAEMDKAFSDLLGDKVKLVDKRLFTHKDINDQLVKNGVNGKEAVKSLIDSARVKVEGRRDLDTDPYRGLHNETGRFIPTGIPSLDEAMNDLAPGRTTLVVGRAGGGKTTLIRQIIANAIGEGARVYLVNGEGDPELFLNALYCCVIGKDQSMYCRYKVNKRWHKEPTKEALKALQQWHRGKLTMFNKGDSKLKTLDQLFKVIEDEVKFKGHDLIVLDNLMSLLTATAAEKLEQQGEFMQRCCDLAKVYRCHFIIVAHPNKTYAKGQDMDFEQISGSSDLYNKADNVIAVIRYYGEDRKFDGKLQLLKNRYYRELETVDLRYDADTGLLQEDREGFAMYYKFNFKP